MENKLEEITSIDFSSLRDLYKVDWPKYILTFNLFEIIRQKNKSCTRVFSLNGDWRNDGTFLAFMSSSEITFATLEPTHNRLKKALTLLNFDEMKTIVCVQMEYLPMIDEFIKETSLTCVMKSERGLQFLSKEDARSLEAEIPRKFSLRPLTKKHACRSLNYMRAFNTEEKISKEISLGLFDDKFNLVASCYQLPFGSLAPLQFERTDLRKRFVQIVAKAMCKKIVQEWNIDVTANIGSSSSHPELFKYLGFKAIDKTISFGLIKYEPEFRLDQLRSSFTHIQGVPSKLIKNSEFL